MFGLNRNNTKYCIKSKHTCILNKEVGDFILNRFINRDYYAHKTAHYLEFIAYIIIFLIGKEFLYFDDN